MFTEAIWNIQSSVCVNESFNLFSEKEMCEKSVKCDVHEMISETACLAFCMPVQTNYFRKEPLWNFKAMCNVIKILECSTFL